MKNFWKHFMNWKILISFGLAWIICNGWAFAAIAIGPYFELNWLVALGTGWVAILMLPNGFGILVPMPIALLIQSLLFPNDNSLKKLLLSIRQHMRKKVKEGKELRLSKKEAKKKAKENEDIIIDDSQKISGE